MSADGDAMLGSTAIPSTPPEGLSVPSTEGPASPSDPSSSLKTELNDDRISSSQVIPSSLTPPPSSQIPQPTATAGHPLGYVSSHRSAMFSPPMTTVNGLRREGNVLTTEYIPPTSDQILDAPMEELRAMFQACLAENARLKMETAHHKLQYNLLSMQADEEAKRATVEHEMTRREVEVLRAAECTRLIRHDLSAAAETTHAKYIQLKALFDKAATEIDTYKRRGKAARKVIQQKEDEIVGLLEERDLLLRRIRENREHFHMLCSPGGAFHGALTPKLSTAGETPRQSSKSHRQENDTQQAGFAALLQALSHDNNSAPSTPTSAHRPVARTTPRHTRGVQSLSSLPTTPLTRPQGHHSLLLPSINLVPQSEPGRRFAAGSFAPETPDPRGGRKSRESTISADDNEELARAALEATQSFMSHASQRSASRTRPSGEGGEEQEVYESQASQAASAMLRRDPRESFDEVASSVGSRDVTPAPVEKSAKLQAKLFAPVTKPGMAPEKRKHRGPTDVDDPRREPFTSPAKKMRYGTGPAEVSRVGLGIQYSQ